MYNTYCSKHSRSIHIVNAANVLLVLLITVSKILVKIFTILNVAKPVCLIRRAWRVIVFNQHHLTRCYWKSLHKQLILAIIRSGFDVFVCWICYLFNCNTLELELFSIFVLNPLKSPGYRWKFFIQYEKCMSVLVRPSISFLGYPWFALSDIVVKERQFYSLQIS